MSINDSLAVKYRPKKLSDVIGQPVVVKAFTNALKSGTMHHAYILAGKYGCGKCVSGDTLVSTNKGLKYIKDMIPDKEGISSIDYRVIDQQGVGDTFFGYHEKDVKTKRITNNLGIEIEATLEHPIRVFNTKNCSIEWKFTGDLRIGDILPIHRDSFDLNKNKKTVLLSDHNVLKEHYLLNKSKGLEEKVTCPICDKKFLQLNTHLKTHNISIKDFKNKYGKDYPVHGKNFVISNTRKSINNIILPSYVNSELARFLGYLLSEGNIDGNTIVFTNSDKEILKDFEIIVYNLFGIKVKKTKDNRKKDLYNYKIHSGLLAFYLDKMGGIDNNSKEKYIPKGLFEWGYDYVSEFLKALFEGDGGINGNRVSYYTISHRLVIELQQLLLSMGIVSYLKKETKKCSNCIRKDNHISYSINISGLDLKIYSDKIGFFSSRKKKALLKLVGKNETNNDTIPSIALEVYNFVEEYLPISRSGKIKINNVFHNAPKKPSNFVSIAKRDGKVSYSKLKEIILYLEDVINLISDKSMNKIVFYQFVDLLELCKRIYRNNFYFSKITNIVSKVNDVYDICKYGDDKSFISNGYISHNTTVARIIAAMENCEKGGKDPCGECRNCKEIFAGNSIEVLELDAASRGGVDDIRAIHKGLYQMPIYCKKKYVIIDEAHSLTRQSAEAALKMIEEPPEFVRFVLCTTEPQSFKPTIHSRCITWKFNSVSWEEMIPLLEKVCGSEGITFDRESLSIITKASKGSVRNSLQNLQTVLNYIGEKTLSPEECREALGIVDFKLYSDLMDGIIEVKIIKCYKAIEDMLKDGKDIGLIVDGIYEYLNNLLMVKACKNDLSSFNFSDSEIKKYTDQANKMKGDMVLRAMNLMNNLVFGVEHSLNPQVLLNKFSTEAMLTNKRFMKSKE